MTAHNPRRHKNTTITLDKGRSFKENAYLNEAPAMRREASRVSFLMCPFCVREWLLVEATLSTSLFIERG